MKVLYVACNPDSAETLTIGSEIRELEQVFRNAQGEPVRFVAYPEMPVEELPIEIAAHRPDVLHISAHGRDGKALVLANANGKEISLDERMLKAFLNFESPPRLIYLNACDSDAIAKALTKIIPMAIGTTAPISNRTARAAARLFYSRLLDGCSVRTAFSASESTIAALQEKGATSRLYTMPGIKPEEERLHHVPRIIARFKEEPTNEQKSFLIETAIFGCPVHVSQVVIFNDGTAPAKESQGSEEEHTSDPRNPYRLAQSLCRVLQGRPVRGTLWCEEAEYVLGDHQLFACGVTGGKEIFAVSSTICDALEYFYRFLTTKEASASITSAISFLRVMDGSGIGGMKPSPPNKTKKKQQHTKKRS